MFASILQQEIFNDTKITITGLNAVTTYRFQVFAENGVSSLVGKSEYVDITVTTEASVPSLVSNVRITSVKNSELSISWDAPDIGAGGDNDLVERYEGKAKSHNNNTLLRHCTARSFLNCHSIAL